ncbi:MAG: IPTL-CTERM sorting domain-containing protein [bacterium]|nr:IPTL-CTERM sorting domain-containing protein [bacterium]
MKNSSPLSPPFRSAILLAALALAATAANAQPTFTKLFGPDTIGPGSVSTLTFTITGIDPVNPVSDLAFTDNLPAGVTIATPANATSLCGGTLSAPDGGGTIDFSGGGIGPAPSACLITVDVTSSTPGTHTNTSGDLSSSAGTTPGPSDDLDVVTTLPGFTKSFAPSSVPLGGRSTLTFTIDNTANAAPVVNLDFTDNLPLGMVIADPASASTDCISVGLPDTTLTATPGTSVITLNADGAGFPGFEVLPAGATCTVTVDVTATGGGMLDNVSGELLASFVSSGKASATLDVTVTPIALVKSFTDDPVPPGGTVNLELTVLNFDRFDPATGIAFTDDLGAALAGLTYSGLLANDCGGSVAGVGTTVITFTGGTVGPGASCTISVSLSVPAGAVPGAYPNTTGAITATISGSPVTGNTASDDLFVEPVPVLTKEFLDASTLAPDPVINAGDDVVMRFTITNTSTTSGATDIAFTDELTTFLPFPVTAVLPAAPCGGSIGYIFPGGDRQDLSLTGGTLTAAPGAGSTCTFDVTLTVPVGVGPGIKVNTTEEITATVDGATRIGLPASDDFTVIAAPRLSKEFTDDPVMPGGTATLEFTLTYPPDAAVDATAISFTDDLAALVPALAGLTANLPPTPDPPCGAGSSLTGSPLLSFAGGTLTPGASCVFSVTLNVPAGAAYGSYLNTTSDVTATVAGATATSGPASDTLRLAGMNFTKEFLGDQVIAGETVTLRFTIENLSSTDAATITSFTDNLAAALPALAATGAPSSDTCGGTLTGTTSLTYTGGGVAAGSTCTIEVPVLVPAAAADGTYINTTSSLAAILGVTPVTIDPAIDDLIVNSNLLQLTKEFTDDPVAPGDPVNLRFTLTNLDAGQAASGIAFTDDLDAALAGLLATGLPAGECGGTVSTPDGGMTIDFSGGTLGPGASCFFDVSVAVPGAGAAGVYPNTTSGVTGTIGGFPVSGDAASDDLVVIDLLLFSKSFDGPTTPGGTPVLTFTITNPGASAASGISFSDDLNAVIPGLVATNLPLANACGPGSVLAGTSFLTLIGGNLAASGGTCSFDVDLLVPGGATVGAFPNTTSDLLQAGLPVAAPATATLTVADPPPVFSKSFGTTGIAVGGVATLIFTIDNTASVTPASGLNFTDNLPAGMEIANPANASTTCTGGVLTAVAGTAVISYVGGTVAAGSSCTVSVDVTVGMDGTYVNTTDDLTSSLGGSGSATATLQVGQNVILIPTLNTWALIVFALLVAVVAARQLRLP